jgi:hypothetical protein
MKHRLAFLQSAGQVIFEKENRKKILYCGSGFVNKRWKGFVTPSTCLYQLHQMLKLDTNFESGLQTPTRIFNSNYLPTTLVYLQPITE